MRQMSIKPLIILPDPVLRLVSKPIERVDAPLLKLADDMLDTMYDAPGIGLAAIQIGEPEVPDAPGNARPERTRHREQFMRAEPERTGSDYDPGGSAGRALNRPQPSILSELPAGVERIHIRHHDICLRRHRYPIDPLCRADALFVRRDRIARE